MDIQLSLRTSRGRFLAVDGESRLGKMTFLREGDTTIIVDHTVVEEHARGRHVGHALFDHMVEWARSNDVKVVATCPFAKALFARRPDAQDVLQA